MQILRIIVEKNKFMTVTEVIGTRLYAGFFFFFWDKSTKLVYISFLVICIILAFIRGIRGQQSLWALLFIKKVYGLYDK